MKREADFEKEVKALEKTVKENKDAEAKAEAEAARLHQEELSKLTSKE